MDFGAALGDSFGYAKDAVVGKWMEWIKLIIATILIAIPLMGYVVKVYRGDKPAPEVTGWVSLIVDGIKLFIIAIIWAIPAFIIFFVTIGSVLIELLAQSYVAPGVVNQAALASAIPAVLPGMLLGFIIFFVVVLITSLLSTIGMIRFARTGSMGEAFNFGAILETIGKIGWLNYIVALIILGVVMMIIGCIFSVIVNIYMPLGLLIEILFVAPVVIFEARYLCNVYDAAKA